MSFSVNQLFLAVEVDNYSALWAAMQKMTPAEMVDAGTAIGPERLRAMLYRFVTLSRLTPASSFLPNPFNFSALQSLAVTPTADTTAYTGLVIAEILAQAFKDAAFLRYPRDEMVRVAVQQRLQVVKALRAARPQINFHRDVTRTLRAASACPAPLSDADYTACALRNGITIAAIKAVAQVESGGRSGFDDAYRPKILFEAHHFRKHTKRLFDITHPHLSCDRASAKKYYSWDQYNRLFEAMVLNPTAAIKACSWGKFQVLGSNHNGWPDPISFATAMFVSENNHLKSFEAYCVTNGLIVHLKDKNWAKFAAGYNGANYAEFSYDTKMAAAYTKYGGT